MPKPKNETASSVPVLLLIDCLHGKCGTVVELSEADAAAAVEVGVADATPAAVEAARE